MRISITPNEYELINSMIANKLQKDISYSKLYDELEGLNKNKIDFRITIKYVTIKITLKTESLLSIRLENKCLPNEIRKNMNEKLEKLGYYNHKTKQSVNCMKHYFKVISQKDDSINLDEFFMVLFKTMKIVKDLQKPYYELESRVDDIPLREKVKNGVEMMSNEDALKFVIYSFEHFKNFTLERGVENPENYFLNQSEYLIEHDDLDDMQFTFKFLLYCARGPLDYLLHKDSTIAAIEEFTRNYNVRYCANLFENNSNYELCDKVFGEMFAKPSINKTISLLETMRWIVDYLKEKNGYNIKEEIREDLYDERPENLWWNFKRKVPNANGFGETLLFTFLADYDPETFDFVIPSSITKRSLLFLLANDVPYSNLYFKDTRINSFLSMKSLQEIIKKAQIAYEENGGYGNLRNLAIYRVLYINGSDYTPKTRDYVSSKELISDNEYNYKQFYLGLKGEMYKSIDLKNYDMKNLYCLTSSKYIE